MEFEMVINTQSFHDYFIYLQHWNNVYTNLPKLQNLHNNGASWNELPCMLKDYFIYKEIIEIQKF